MALCSGCNAGPAVACPGVAVPGSPAAAPRLKAAVAATLRNGPGMRRGWIKRWVGPDPSLSPARAIGSLCIDPSAEGEGLFRGRPCHATTLTTVSLAVLPAAAFPRVSIWRCALGLPRA